MSIKSLIITLVTIVIMLLPTLSKTQTIEKNGWGIKGGVSINLGTHIQRIGIMFQGYYFDSFIQGNIGTQSYYNFRTLGPKVKSWEIVPNIGVHAYWGSQENSFFNPDFSTISIQSQSPYAIGYSFKYYWDTKGTSQPSGLITVNIKNVIFSTENDIFVMAGEDKYRTGSLTLQYHNDMFSFYITSLMWTGARNKTKLIKSSDYPAPFGYLNISESKYGRISHGTLAIGARYSMNYHQTASAEIGFDSERIRHFFQNKVIHDMPMFPKKWNKADNPHYPMLKEDGTPYLFKEGDKLRKTKFYFQTGINQPVFY